jgi:hypothetical protein
MDNNSRKRDPRNAPGPFYAVEKLCLACGLPEDEAPELLANLDESDGDTYFIKQPTTPEEVERACSAITVCCVGALRYAGNDPAIIQRLQKWSTDCCDATEAKGNETHRLSDKRTLQQTGSAVKRSWFQRLFGRGR